MLAEGPMRLVSYGRHGQMRWVEDRASLPTKPQAC